GAADALDDLGEKIDAERLPAACAGAVEKGRRAAAEIEQDLTPPGRRVERVEDAGERVREPAGERGVETGDGPQRHDGRPPAKAGGRRTAGRRRRVRCGRGRRSLLALRPPSRRRR